MEGIRRRPGSGRGEVIWALIGMLVLGYFMGILTAVLYYIKCGFYIGKDE